jgi:trehalose 6-phosphate phosphatase
VAFDPDRLAPLRGDPATAGIFSDFDGTLSPIVADPELAEPLPGIAPLLEELARRYRVVAVVSGVRRARPVGRPGYRRSPDRGAQR